MGFILYGVDLYNFGLFGGKHTTGVGGIVAFKRRYRIASSFKGLIQVSAVFIETSHANAATPAVHFLPPRRVHQITASDCVESTVTMYRENYIGTQYLPEFLETTGHIFALFFADTCHRSHLFKEHPLNR